MCIKWVTCTVIIEGNLPIYDASIAYAKKIIDTVYIHVANSNVYHRSVCKQSVDWLLY